MRPLWQGLRRAWNRLRGAMARRRSERELAAEVAFHIEMQVEDNLRCGMSAAEAVRAARLKFGNLQAVKESCRDQGGLPGLESIAADLRYAMRGWRRSPGFTLTAVVALGLGIGATTAIFSLVNAELLKPLPFPDTDRLVILRTTSLDDDGQQGSNPIGSPAMFAHWRKQSSVLQDVSAFTLGDGVMNYTGGEVVEQWDAMRVSSGLFRCLGYRILRGRAFTTDEELPNKPLVALIGQTLWEHRFASDPGILGKRVSLNGNFYTVIGIVADDPALLVFGSFPQVYVPFQFDPNTSDQNQSFIVAARLKAGVTIEQARDRLRASSDEYRARFPMFFGPKNSFGLMPFQEFLTGDMRGVLLVLQCAVTFVLLIACANVANLLLVRGAARRREMGIRAAIGAARGRIVRQLLTESVLLSLAGGALGLGLGFGGIRALLAVNTADLHRVGDNGAAVQLDWHLVAFVLAVSLLTTFLCGLAPALHGARVDLNSVLKDGGRSGTGMRHNRARATLVVSEVALAVLLLVGAGLLIRTFTELYKVHRGFDTKNVLTMQVLLTGPKHATSAGVAETIRDSVERIRALPGVSAASAAFSVPLQSQDAIALQIKALTFDIVGRPAAGVPAIQMAGWTTVSPGFFEVFNIPVKRGRAFTWRDGAKASPVVMINETLARQYWKEGDPLNDRIVIGRSIMTELKDEPVRQIIGIVGDVRDTGLDNVPRPVLYVPQAQVPDAYTARFFRDDFMTWVVRTRTTPGRLAPAIQEQLRKATGLPVSGLLSMDEVVSLSTARQRFSMLLMSIFSCSALVLAVVGLYGLMAYTVAQRRQEIGIRLALGADAAGVKKMVVWQGMRLVLWGVGVGLVGAWSGSRVMESLLYGVQPRDPVAFAATPLVLMAVALVAVWLPARHASRVDPAVALRYE